MNAGPVVICVALVFLIASWAFSGLAPRALKLYQRVLLIPCILGAGVSLWLDGIAAGILIDWLRTSDARVRPGLLESLVHAVGFTMIPAAVSGAIALVLRRALPRWFFWVLMIPSAVFLGGLSFILVRGGPH